MLPKLTSSMMIKKKTTTLWTSVSEHGQVKPKEERSKLRNISTVFMISDNKDSV